MHTIVALLHRFHLNLFFSAHLIDETLSPLMRTVSARNPFFMMYPMARIRATEEV